MPVVRAFESEKGLPLLPGIDSIACQYPILEGFSDKASPSSFFHALFHYDKDAVYADKPYVESGEIKKCVKTRPTN